ncbi:glycosyltransferase family 4 protein [Agreia sp. Leaf244]|uniref:glycosyltransferase family 4 protein n=1 Tax=Agreia sp. Leaf244 TaxID=1736305 RepID=UPI001910AAF7|nr:glycosyltransferase family 1 protein [Agreia sp. Leaf244]
MARETLRGLTSSPGEILHYSADTGPLLHTRGASVVTVHGVASRWIDVARTARQEATWRFRVSTAIKSTRRLITVSQSAADDISEVFGVERQLITVIPHGIDSEMFSSPRVISDELRAQIPSQFVLYLGNVEPRKNLIDLVRAFETDEIRSFGVPLLIAGKPAWNFDDAMKTINAASNVQYLGFVSDSDRVALMQACSLFVFPSLYEGFGFPVLEAMAAGAPVVTSRRGSLAEVAGPAYEMSDLTAYGLADTISKALSDTAWLARVPDDGREWARQFEWGKSVDEHIRVYGEVVSE